MTYPTADQGAYILIDETGDWPARWSRTAGKPDAICVHRTGNPKPEVKASSNNKWARRTAKASWHEIIDDSDGYNKPVVREMVPADIHAWHILEWRLAAQMGREVGPMPWRNQKRGDYRVYGIEVDEDPDGWNRATRDAIVARLADLIEESRRPDHGRFARALGVMDIKGHSEFDKRTRSRDPDELWLPAEIRSAVAEELRRREKERKAARAPRYTGPGVTPSAAPLRERHSHADLNARMTRIEREVEAIKRR